MIVNNRTFAHDILSQIIASGIKTFCLCAGSRNSPLTELLADCTGVEIYTTFEERSAAFFALGRIKRLQAPVAVVTTSGTAAAELFPAIIEAHYTGLPLVAITADRPRRYRGTGAPQSIEQAHIFGTYASFYADVEIGETVDLSAWEHAGPAHINICFDEPLISAQGEPPAFAPLFYQAPPRQQPTLDDFNRLDNFLNGVKKPLAVVGALPVEAREKVSEFLEGLNIPCLLEASSGLRCQPALQHLAVRRRSNIWQKAAEAAYPIDGILRIGGVPTVNLWRDLEKSEYSMPVFSISNLPFSGLSCGDLLTVNLEAFFATYTPRRSFLEQDWVAADLLYDQQLEHLIARYPLAEPSLMHQLSTKIPMRSTVYLGNSMPIRDWDLTATYEQRQYDVHANRGANGIDGQLSTFLGLCDRGVDAWALLGDLTTLYDLSAPWMLGQMESIAPQIVVINNKGGMIFRYMYKKAIYQNSHTLSFEPFAKLWNLDYVRWETVPDVIVYKKPRLIELVPLQEQTDLFRQELKGL